MPGKTTLLKLLTGELGSDSGEARLLGRVVGGTSQDAFASLGFCMQHNALYDPLTVRQHLQLFGTIKGIEPRKLAARIDYLLTLLAIDEFGDKPAKTLSGGTKRKLAFALALVASPRVLFLDEPTSGVDVATRRHMWRVMQRTSRHSGTLLTTHALEEAETLCDRIAILVNGALKALGTARHLRNTYGRGYVVELHCASEAAADAALEAFAARYDDCETVSRLHGTLRLRIRQTHDVALGVDDLCDTIQFIESLSDIEESSVSQPTLEQVFIRFAAHQVERAD